PVENVAFYAVRNRWGLYSYITGTKN
ncbi:MAG: hypothetical protein JWQ09_3183, partial [Segetibacter sp.]|nr:hypothetical protein [Segetibacter sp.]